MVGITVCALLFLLANLGHGSVVIDDPVQVAYINTMQDMFKDQLRAMSSMMLNMGSVFADVKFNNLMRSGDYETPQVSSSSPFSLQIFSDQSREGHSPQEQTTYRSYLRGPSLFFFHDRKDTEPPCSKPFQTNYLRSVNINKPTETQHQDQSSSFSGTSSDPASGSSYSSSSSTEESFSTSDNYEYSYSGLLDDDDFMFMDDSADDNDNNKDDSIYYIASNAPATIPTSGQGSSEEVVLIDKVSEDQVPTIDSSRDSGDNVGDSADMGMEERMRKPDEFYTAGSSSAVIGSPEQVPSAVTATDLTADAIDSAVPSDVTTSSENGNMVDSADSADSTITTDAAAVDADQKQDNIGNINSNNNNDKYEDQKSASITTEHQSSETAILEQHTAVEPQVPLALSTTAGDIDSTDLSVLSDPLLTTHTDLHAIHQDMENLSKPELRE